MSIVSRINEIIYGHWTTTSAPTGTHKKAYEIAADEFTDVLAQLQTLVETDLKGFEDKAESASAPWTPGRVPRWKRN
jgi:hypothetical protein